MGTRKPNLGTDIPEFLSEREMIPSNDSACRLLQVSFSFVDAVGAAPKLLCEFDELECDAVRQGNAIPFQSH